MKAMQQMQQMAAIEAQGQQLAQLEAMKQAGQDVPDSKPVFEFNPKHALLQKMDLESDDDKFKDYCLILFDQSMLAEGGMIDDPAGYVSRLNKVLTDGL